MRRRAWLACGLVLLLGCSVGEGEGEVRSDRLFVEDCWNGPFDLNPTFFAANPHKNTLIIRIQRGDNIEETSDGVVMVISDIKAVREGTRADSPPRLELGLPPGVSIPGVPVEENPDPPLVSMALYLQNTCHAQNGTVYAIDPADVGGGVTAPGDGFGITFTSLFSGDRNEQNADDRLTEATFTALMADPRVKVPGGAIPVEKTSVVEGSFRFFFQRGQPAQPFP